MNESLRRRLEALNRGAISETSTAARQPPASPPRVRGNRQSSARRVKPIPGLLRMADVVQTTAGPHARICLPVNCLWPGGEQRVLARGKHLSQLPAAAVTDNQPTNGPHSDFARLVRAFPHRVCCLDLETCGLAGAALFLIGLLRTINDQLVVELLLARSYAEEHAVLESFWQTAADWDVVVTFNGKSFDWPFLQDRSQRYLMFRRVPAPTLLHLDVLHHARRRWRSTLPNCRLQTLETAICHRQRVDDIPGNQIPAAYAEYVRTGFERDVDSILFHNAMDLVTLLDLAMRLAA